MCHHPTPMLFFTRNGSTWARRGSVRRWGLKMDRQLGEATSRYSSWHRVVINRINWVVFVIPCKSESQLAALCGAFQHPKLDFWIEKEKDVHSRGFDKLGSYWPITRCCNCLVSTWMWICVDIHVCVWIYCKPCCLIFKELPLKDLKSMTLSKTVYF